MKNDHVVQWRTFVRRSALPALLLSAALHSSACNSDIFPGDLGGADGGTPVCNDANAGIAWAGNWGMYLSHGCIYYAGADNPFVVDKTGIGHDCQIITAEIWIPGVTDVGADSSLIRAQVVHEIDSMGVDDLTKWTQIGNNYRYAWNPGVYHPNADQGSTPFYFQFSHGDENQGCWYRIDLNDGPSGGTARTLSILP